MRPRPLRWLRLKVASIYKLSLEDGLMHHQLVGEVTAHQGFDG
jgi:hypothetical protein